MAMSSSFMFRLDYPDRAEVGFLQPTLVRVDGRRYELRVTRRKKSFTPRICLLQENNGTRPSEQVITARLNAVIKRENADF